MLKSLYELAGFPRFFLVDFLDPGVWDCSLTLSSAGVGAGVNAGTSAISTFSSLSSDLKSKEAEALV